MGEPTNVDRAGFAEKALDTFEMVTGSEEDTRIYDFLCNLMHYCDLHDLDIDDQMAMAERHYKDELAEEAEAKRAELAETDPAYELCPSGMGCPDLSCRKFHK